MAADGKERTKPSLGFRFGLVYFVYFTIYSISSPYLSVILRKIGYSHSSIGLLLGLFELIGIAGPIVLARAADSRGRFNPFLVGSGVLILAGGALIVWVRNPIAAAAGLGMLALGLKTPVPVMDTAALIAIEGERARKRGILNYGTMRALGSAGYVLVLIALQSLPGFDAEPPAVIYLTMAGLTLAYLASLLCLPEMGSGPRPERRTALNVSWIDSTFAAGIVVIALGRLALASYNAFFSLYLIEELDWHAISAMSALSATVEIPMMLVAWKFMRRHSPMAAIAISSLAIIARLAIYAIFPSRGGVVGGQLLHSLCYGLFQPASVAFVNLKTPPAERTTGMALLLGFGIGLPAFLGSAIGGAIVDVVGYRWMFALFGLFAVASVALYKANAASLDSVR